MAKKQTNALEFITRYRITGAPGEEVVFTYIGGRLEAIEGLRKGWTLKILSAPCLTEEDMFHYCKATGDKVEKLETPSMLQKIAMFCEAFKLYLNMAYKVLPGEGKKLEPLEITPELLKTYFDVRSNKEDKENGQWWATEKTIRNLASNYNAIRLINAGRGTGNGESPKQGGSHTNDGDLAKSIFARRSGQ